MPHSNAVAEQVLGTMGTIFWTIQLVPQVWKSYRSKDTTGLSHWLVFLWGAAAIFLGVYVIVQRLNIPLTVQPQSFGFLAFLCWGQCQYYGLKRSRKVAILMTLSVIILSGLLEFILVVAVQSSHGRSRQAATQFFGIFASVLVAAGLFPQYWEIYKYKEVIGISLLFMTVDLLGGVFSLLSLVFKDNFDVIAAVTYSAVVVLDGVVVVAALILNPMARRRRRKEVEKHASELTQQQHVATQDQSNSLKSADATGVTALRNVPRID